MQPLVRGVLVSLATLAACTDGSVGTSATGGGTTASSSSDAGSTSAGSTSTSTAGMSSTSAAITTTTATTSSTSDTSATETACKSDVGAGSDYPCDPWLQDCCPGEKCTAWANDGGWGYNDLRCAPIDPDPDPIGEPCVAQGTSGNDSCGARAICWNVDPLTLMGRCVALCEGPEIPCSEGRESCCPEGFFCRLTETLAFPLCIQRCDPLAQDCQGSGLVCYAADASFRCLEDESGEHGAAGDPCDFTNYCDPGLYCGSSLEFPGCDLEAGCCTPFCALDSPECPPGTECLPLTWLADPREGAKVGGCTIPP